MRVIKFLGCLFSKRHVKVRSTVIIKPNLIKRDYVQIDHNLILFCDKVGLDVHFCVHRNEPKRHLRERLEASP